METSMLALKRLSTTEEFQESFAIEYQPVAVRVNRLHILRRFHQYLLPLPALQRGEKESNQSVLRCRRGKNDVGGERSRGHAAMAKSHLTRSRSCIS